MEPTLRLGTTIRFKNQYYIQVPTLGLGIDIRDRYQPSIKLQGWLVDTNSILKMHASSASWCLPSIAIEIIVIRHLQEWHSKFTKDRDR